VIDGDTVGTDCNAGDHACIESGTVVGDPVTVKNQVFLWEGVTPQDGHITNPNFLTQLGAKPGGESLGMLLKRPPGKKNFKKTSTFYGAQMRIKIPSCLA
jgi:UDP-3-O-[3-hydroxymyristoyl] glucosamine N-acyltransferase